MSFSYIRAGLSALPFIGPLISVDNLVQNAQELKSAVKRTENISMGIIKARCTSVLHPGRRYAVFGIIGCIWTVDEFIDLAYLGILNRVAAISAVVLCTALALVYTYILHEQTKHLLRLQT